MSDVQTALDVAKSSIEYAYSEAGSAIRHAIDYVDPYISSHPINMFSDSDAFRSAVSSMQTEVRNVVNVKISDAFNGYNIRSRNAGYNLSSSSPTDAQLEEFSSLISERGSSLQNLSQSIIAQSDELVSSHIMDRPLMQPTGRRETPTTISHDSPNTFKYEFKNIGNKPWSGWINIKLTDQYKNTVVVDFPPSSIPVVSPGDIVVLTRDIDVPAVQYKDGEPRSWGDKTTARVSLHTRISA